MAGPSNGFTPLLQKKDELPTPTASTMTFQGQGCSDHLCEKKDCSECVDDRFKPLAEFEFLDKLDCEMLAKLRELGWGPELGSPLDHFDEHGDSLLHLAARNGDVEVMKKLLEIGVPSDTCCQGQCCRSPLMVACRWCHPDCVCLLLDHGARIDNVIDQVMLHQVVDKSIGMKRDRAKIRSLLNDKGMTAKAAGGSIQEYFKTLAFHMCAGPPSRLLL